MAATGDLQRNVTSLKGNHQGRHAEKSPLDLPGFEQDTFCTPGPYS